MTNHTDHVIAIVLGSAIGTLEDELQHVILHRDSRTREGSNVDWENGLQSGMEHAIDRLHEMLKEFSPTPCADDPRE